MNQALTPTPHRAGQIAMGAGALLLAALLAFGAVAIPSDAGYAGVGPDFLPWVLSAALAVCGVLLLRVGDAAAGLPFKISNWVDAVVTFVRGHRLSRLYCRPLAEWQARLSSQGFGVDTIPMPAGTPFANILLVARKPA